jgi:hypothetical protein
MSLWCSRCACLSVVSPQYGGTIATHDKKREEELIQHGLSN